MHRIARGIWLLVVLFLGGPATAAWQRASSAHFVIYSNDSPTALRAFSARLETFDKAVRHVRGMDDPPIGDGNRLTVFVVPNEAVVQKLEGDKSGFIAGFYSGRASGSLAVVPRASKSNETGEMTPQVVFFHEYSHHLMFENLSQPYPEWLVEGFAEFMATARFERDGSVGLGIPPQFRAYGLFGGNPMSVERLLSSDFAKLSPEDRETAYGRSWLLTHYLNFNSARSGQLTAYVAQIAQGTGSVDAARKVFGDLKKLDRELDSYLNQSSVRYIKVKGIDAKEAHIDVEPLSPGGAAVMDDRIRSKVGVDKTTAEPLAVRVRAIERKYPGDLLVERTLAEAELDAGHHDAALAAADRALKTEPRDDEAMIFKGQALMAGDTPDRFAAARKLFLAANKVDTEDPKPLMYFYMSYLREGKRPTDNAIAALHYASDLAPQDLALRLNSGVQYLRDGKPVEARRTLVPVAYDPHGEYVAKLARSIITRIDAKDTKAALGLVDDQAQLSNK